MELTDGELTLRNPTENDADAVADAVQQSLAELSPWMPWASDDYTRDTALQWIRGEFDQGHRFLMIANGRHVGSCGLNDLDALNRRANLGYWVRSDTAGMGFATRATKLLRDFGHAQGLHRLEVIMSTENAASRRVAEKAGAAYEGIARGRLFLDGRFHDTHVFSFVPDQASS